MSVIDDIMREINSASRMMCTNEIPSKYYRAIGTRKVDEIIRKHMNAAWIPAKKELPKENTCIDKETGYYGRSDDVLCSAYDDYTGEYETWIDYTIDGRWQTHEWYEGEPLAWMPLPEPYGMDGEG